MKPHDKNGHAVDTDGVPVYDSLCSVCNPIHAMAEKGCCDECNPLKLKEWTTRILNCYSPSCSCHTKRIEHKDLPHCPNCIFPPNFNCDCSCHKTQKEEWQQVLQTKLDGHGYVLNQDAIDYIKSFISSLLTKEREDKEKRFTQAYNNGLDIGRQQVLTQLRELVAEKIKSNYEEEYGYALQDILAEMSKLTT